MFSRLPFFRKSDTYTVAGDVWSPPPLLLSLLVWCWCGAGVVVLMVLLLLSRLCEDEALSRTQQARCAVVCVCDSWLWVVGDAYSRQVSYQIQSRRW